MLGRMHERIAEVRSRKPLDLRRELLRPDIVFLLQAARDHYAVEQFDARLKRFAAVVSGRIVEPDRPFDVDLEFARAALDLSDDAVRFLAIAVSRAAEGATIGHRQEGRPEKQPIPGELRVSMYVRSRPWRTASAVAPLGASLRTLEARGMIENAGFISGMEAVNCDDRATARYRDNVWVPTALGAEFMQRIDAAIDDGPDACSETAETSIEAWGSPPSPPTTT